MALVTVGPGFLAPGSASTPYAPSAPSAPVVAAPPAAPMPADSYTPASTGSTPAPSGTVQAKSFLGNLWDSFLGPLFNGLFGAISSIFKGL